MSTLKNEKVAYFENIDILRGFAAVSVLVYHVIEHCQWSTFPSSGLLAWFRVGWLGVDLFFVISGFVIGLSAFSAIEHSGAAGFRQYFFIRRLARIVPLYYATLIIFSLFVAPALLFSNFFANLAAHLFFVHNWFIHLHGSINGSNWSLGTEMQFYLLMILVSPWLKNVQWHRFVCLFVLIAWVWRYSVSMLVSPTSDFGSFPIFIAATQLPGMLDEFAGGIVLARLVRSSYWPRLTTRKFLPIALAFFVAFCSTYITLSIYWKYASFWDYPLMIVFWRSLVAFSCTAVILCALVLRVPLFLKAVSAPFKYLGTLSYGMYLWHLPVLLSLKRVDSVPPLSVLLITLCCSVLLASLSWHFYEQAFVLGASKARDSRQLVSKI